MLFRISLRKGFVPLWLLLGFPPMTARSFASRLLAFWSIASCSRSNASSSDSMYVSLSFCKVIGRLTRLLCRVNSTYSLLVLWWYSLHNRVERLQRTVVAIVKFMTRTCKLDAILAVLLFPTGNRLCLCRHIWIRLTATIVNGWNGAFWRIIETFVFSWTCGAVCTLHCLAAGFQDHATCLLTQLLVSFLLLGNKQSKSDENSAFILDRVSC